MTDHKATPEQWADAGAFASDTRACLLELRARVEALEAAQPKQITQEELAKLLAQPATVVPLATERGASKVYEISKPLKLTPDQVEQLLDQLRPTSKRTPSPSQSSSSLVERVSCAIDGRINPDQWLHQDAARAAIREVAAWFGDRATPGTPQWIASAELTDEVER